MIMGMPISIHLHGYMSDAYIRRVIDDAFSLFEWVDETFSPFKPTSAVCKIQAGELTFDEVHESVREVRDLCLEASQLTLGYFSAMKPSAEGASINWDPTGLVKGWAIEKAANVLLKLSDVDFYINAGGDIFVGSTSQTPLLWRIAIENPVDPQRAVATVELRRGAIATSGNTYRGEHILNPYLKKPANDLSSVSVIGESIMWADVFATAAFARGDDSISWLDAAADYDAVVVANVG